MQEDEAWRLFLCFSVATCFSKSNQIGSLENLELRIMIICASASSDLELLLIGKKPDTTKSRLDFLIQAKNPDMSGFILTSGHPK